MPSFDLVRDVPIVRTPRLLQMEGMFDVPPSKRSEQRWHIDLDLPETWNVGVIVGPSGAGKSTVAREVFGDALSPQWDWPDDKSVLDGFPQDMGIRDIVDLLSSVGFSSPPSWVRPFHVLSNGEQFRVNLARTLAEMPSLAVVDEFTSVVDRTAAQIGSAAVAKTVRRRGQQFVAVSCHYDILDWLEPDWVYQPHINQLERGRLRQRPAITLDVARVHRSAWNLFRQHHYLDTGLNSAAACFVAFWQSRPAAFSAWLGFPHKAHKSAYREHRTVCHPDFQGVGIGNALSDYIASAIAARGSVVVSATSHPAMVRSRAKSPNWRMTRRPSFSGGNGSYDSKSASLNETRASSRLTAGFRYVGPKLSRNEADALWAA